MSKFIKKKTEEQADSFELGTLRMVIRNLYPDVLDYEEQAQLIEKEFGYQVTGRDIWLLDEPTIEQEQKEYELLMRNRWY